MPVTLPRITHGRVGSTQLNRLIAALESAVNGTYPSSVLIAAVTGLQAALDLLAPLASPTFTGTVTIPTAASADSSTKAASTAFVADALIGGLPLRLKSYAVATVPAAGAGNARQMVWLTDGNAGAACVAVSTGSAWKVIALGSTAAAS